MSKYTYGCCKHCGSYRELTKKGLCVLCDANVNVDVTTSQEFIYSEEEEDDYSSYEG